MTAVFITGLMFVCCRLLQTVLAEGVEGDLEEVVQSACRDRYLWIQVSSEQMPRFEAVVQNGVHVINEQLASRCGYTISSFKADGIITFKASYYSCFTQNQNDEVFTFRFNVIMTDGAGGWSQHPVSAVCSGLNWTHREIMCEEDYMEVNVDRESTCGGQVWQSAFSQAQRTASSTHQLMFLQPDGQVTSMSIGEAERQGYTLSSTANRVVLRSQYRGPHAELLTVDGVPVEVLRLSLFFRKKLMVLMIDLSMACTLNPGSFDGALLFWDIPRVITPLVGEGAMFESRSLSVGVEGVLLDVSTATTRGFNLVQQGNLVQITVPFGAEGGHRKSLVMNNMYKETYAIFLLYEHVFSLRFEDGSSIDTRHRMYRVIDTPLVCRPAFSLDKTLSDAQVFNVYLGNVPADVVLEEVWINRKRLQPLVGAGHSITPVVHVNGSQGFELRVPFEDNIVHRTYLGGGVVQYSIEVNFTLTIMPQRDSYFHHTFITAHVYDAFPPEITAQCFDGGVSFVVVSSLLSQSLWEVSVGLEPLTSQLATKRGYRLHSDGHRTTLDVPVLSIGYTYEDINLSDFYGTFKLVIRDSKTLEVQTSTSKRCLFKTQDMIVCSADGAMTVVTTLASTWPMVQADRTRLLDSTCGPKQTDGARVLFQFKLDSCGTRYVVGELYVVYENEILHDRQLIADGPNFISRESQFKMTVRCFYPLSAVSRLSVDRIFTSNTPGFGSVQVFKSFKVSGDPSDKHPAAEYSRGGSDQTIRGPTKPVQHTPETGFRPWIKPGPSHFIRVPGHRQLLSSQTSDLHQTIRDPLQVLTPPGPVMSQNEDQLIFGFPTEQSLPNLPLGYNQVSHINTPNFNSVDRAKHLASRSGSSGRIPNGVDTEQVQTLQGFNSLGNNVWHYGETNVKQGVPPNRETQRPSQELEARLALSLYGSSGGWMETPLSSYQPATSRLHQVFQPPAQYNVDHTGTTKLHLPREKKDSPDDTKDTTCKTTDSDSHGDTQPYVRKHLNPTANSQVKNLERTESIQCTSKTIKQGLQNRRVQNVRIKPHSRIRSSGRHHLNRNPQILSSSQYRTDPTSISWTSQQPSDHRGQEREPDRSGLPTLKEEHGVHRVHMKPQGAGVQNHNVVQNLVWPGVHLGNSGGQERNVPQQAASHIRVRPSPGLTGQHTPERPGHLDQQSQQNPDQVTAVKTSLTSQLTSNALTSHMRPGDTGSDLQTRSDCGGLYGTSVHHGIRRGEWSS